MRVGFFLLVAGFAPDALAWGLQTHVFLAQWLLAAAPFADPRIRAAALRLPRLVLAGACLPDLALIGRVCGIAEFRSSHRWSTLRRLAATCWEDERAVAVGYASHLLADGVAHHGFVPEHERRIADIPHLTHAICEWALDEQVCAHLEEDPAALLRAEIGTLSEAAARAFGCSPGLAKAGIGLLARAEASLRASRLPALCRRGFRLHGAQNYLRSAMRLLRRTETVLQGAEPGWEPEPERQATRKDAPASSAPSAAPAITSLG